MLSIRESFLHNRAKTSWWTPIAVARALDSEVVSDSVIGLPSLQREMAAALSVGSYQSVTYLSNRQAKNLSQLLSLLELRQCLALDPIVDTAPT